MEPELEDVSLLHQHISSYNHHHSRMPHSSNPMTLETTDEPTNNKCNNVQFKSSKQIKLDVGGYKFTTTLTTLTADPDCMLAAMFSGRFMVERNEDGCVFIDRDGQYFHHILNWLRNGTLPLIDNPVEREYLLVESKYYQITSLNECLLAAQDPHIDLNEKFTLKELLKLVNLTPPGRKLQLSSADLTGLNLDGICLQGANIKFAKLDRATLQYANLQEVFGQNASLNYADLQNTDLSLAQLPCCRLQHARLNNANLQGANLAGADMTNCDLQGANLQGANLQGAILQGANVQYTNLLGAKLHGASLHGITNVHHAKGLKR